MKTTIFLSIFLLFSLFGFSQEDEFNKFKEQTENNFISFAEKNQATFNSFVEKNDKDFSNFLRKAWDKYEGNKPRKPKLGTKPIKKPILKNKEKKRAKNIEEREILSVQTPKIIPKAISRSLPPIQKKESVLKNKSNISVSFFGLNPEFSFDSNLKETLGQGDISPDLIADFWEAASDCNHYDLVNDLMEFKLKQKLNDWAYYQLVGEISSKIVRDNKNHAKLLKWFLLIKSRYDTKIGYNSNNIYVMVASEYMIFSKNYFSFDNINYFILDNDNVTSLRSYKENYPDAKLKLNFGVDESPILGKNVKERNLEFSYLSNNYKLDLSYNKSNIDFYNTIPQLDLPLYFNAGSSSEFTNSLVESLKPLIEDIDEFTAVSFLLKFAQTSFDYKTDPQQFGYEKFFFAEETVFYPYSDCEDRSVFFATLIQELLNLEVVGLEYPGHVATAIKFSENRTGDHLFYNNEKYIICDPTFINAPIGMCMPQFINVEAKVIPLKINRLEKSHQDEIKSIIIAAGGKTRNINIETDKDGSSYVVGTYDEILTFKENNLSANKNEKNLFFAKFDKEKELLWASKISGDNKLNNKFVKISSDGSTYIAGSIGKSAKFGDNLITIETVESKIFIVKYDENGIFEWIKTSPIPEGATDDYIFVAKYNSIGDEISTLLFEKNKGFDNYGINFTSKGDIILTSEINKNK